jgi:hypothetical protein
LKHLVLALVIAVSTSGKAKAAQDDLTVGKKVSEQTALSLSGGPRWQGPKPAIVGRIGWTRPSIFPIT